MNRGQGHLLVVGAGHRTSALPVCPGTVPAVKYTRVTITGCAVYTKQATLYHAKVCSLQNLMLISGVVIGAVA